MPRTPRNLGIAKWASLPLAALAAYTISFPSRTSLTALVAGVFALVLLHWLPSIFDRWRSSFLVARDDPGPKLGRMARRMLPCLAVLIALLWLASVKSFIRVPIMHDRAVALGEGSLIFYSGPVMDTTLPAWVFGAHPRRVPLVPHSTWLGTSRTTWHHKGDRFYRSDSYPIGPLALIVISFTLGLHFVAQTKVPANHCPNCNYNLTGNQSNKCPECGTPRTEPAAQASACESQPR